MRYGRIAVFLTAVLMALGLFAMGCSSGTEAGEETSGKPVVIDFWRPGCPPCDDMEPVIAQLKEEYGGRVDFKAYNVLEERGKADNYGIVAVPTFVFIDADGNVVSKVVGKQGIETMRAKIESILSSPT